MKRTGSSMSRSAVRAARLPPSARSSSRDRRAVTSAYSAATKTALPSTSTTHEDDAQRVAHRASGVVQVREKPGQPGPWYWAVGLRPSCGQYRQRSRRLPRGRRGRGEHVFYTRGVRVEYREEPCRSALNRVKGMPFEWSLNPYMGCAHRCTFCYVRAFERRADRPSDDRYGRTIRVKTNVAEVLARELARPSWRGEPVVDRRGDRPVPAGRGPLPADAGVPRGAGRRVEPVQHHHARAADRPRRRRPARGGGARRGVRQLLDPDARPRGLAHDRARDGAAAAAPARAEDARRRRDQGRRRDGADPAGALRPARAARAGRPRGARGGRDARVGERAQPPARDARALPRGARPRLARGARALRAAVRRPGVPDAGRTRASRCAASPRCGPVTASPTGGASAIEPPARPEQLTLAV